MAGASSAENKFPHLSPGNYVQVFADYGLIKSKLNAMSVRVSTEAIELLKACDGLLSIRQIIENHLNSERRGTDSSLSEAIVTINRLIRNSVIVLESDPGTYAVPLVQSEGCHYPEAMHVEVTTVCNLHCYFCYRKSGPGKSEIRLPTDSLLNILGQLSDTGLRVVELTGGEPLLHPDFNVIADFCGKTFPLTSILTNGTLVNEAFVTRMIPLRDRVAFNISLESHRPEEHDRRSGVEGSCQKTVEAIRQLAKHDFMIRVAMAVDRANWNDVEPTLRLAKDLGATAFTYSAIMPFGRAASSLGFWDLDIKDVSEKEKYLYNTYKDFFHILDYQQQQRMKQPGSCGGGHRTYAMDPAGNVRPCATFESQTGVIGSLASHTPKEVFGHELTKLFAEIEAPRPEVCGSCKFTYFCRNCVLRGLTAYRSLGTEKCAWMEQAITRKWAELIQDMPLPQSS